MELVLIIGVAIIVWAVVDGVSKRQDRVEGELRELRESLAEIKGTVAWLVAELGKVRAPEQEARRPAAAPLEAASAPVPAAAAAVVEGAEPRGGWTPTHRIPGGGMDVRELPDSLLPPIATLPEDLRVAVESRSGGWALIETEAGRRGWVNVGHPVAGPSPLGAAAVGGLAPLREASPLPAPAATIARPASRPAAESRRATVSPEEVRPADGLVHQVLLKLGFTPPAAGESWSRTALEAWLEGRILAVVGGAALLLGAVFFLSLAFSSGWISEQLRVDTGLAVGACLLLFGELSFTRLRGIVGHVLVAVGLATISLALFAATRLYNLIPVEWALLGIFVAAVAAAGTAIRHDSEIVAAFGLIAVLASPPVLGASPSLVTLLFVAAALVGTTCVALFRTWSWLPPLAFVLAAPQFAFYITGAPPLEEGLIAIEGFWLVNLVAAAGEEIRHSTDRLRTATVTLLLADAAVTLWAGFTVLSGTYTEWRGTFLVLLAGAYLALGLAFFVRNGDRHPFGLLVAATGVAALTMAVPIQFGGPPVPIAWAAEAVALAWVAVIRRHPYSAAVSVLLAILAVGHLVSIEYPPSDLVTGFSQPVPFVGPEGMTFAFMIAALAVATLLVPIAWVRAGLVVAGGLVALYVFPFELSGPALVAAWATLAAAGMVVYARVVMPRMEPDFHENRIRALGLPPLIGAPVTETVSMLSGLVRPSFLAAAILAGVGSIAHLASFEYPAGSIYAGTPYAIPFVGLPGLAFAVFLTAIVVTGLLVPIASTRVGLTALGGLIALYVFPFELSGPSLVAAWAALATGGFAVEALIIEPRVGPAFDGAALTRRLRPAVRAVGALTGLAVLTHLVVVDFPIGQLAERVRFGHPVLTSIPYAGQEGLSLAAALAGLAAVSWVMGARWIRLAMTGIGAALLAFTVTFEVDVSLVAVPWSILVLASLFIVRRVALVEPLPAERGPVFRAGQLLEAASERLPYAAAVLALFLLLLRSLWLADIESFGRYVTGNLQPIGTPFLDQRTFVLSILAGTVLISGWIWRDVTPRVLSAVAAALPIAWLLPFEVRPGYAVAGWSALALVGFLALRIVPAARLVLGGASLALTSLGAIVTLAIVAPPNRLIVSETTTVLGWSLLTDATVALVAIAISLGAGGLLHRRDQLSRPVLIAAGVAAIYLLSVAVVDQFRLQVGTRPLEELQKGAQVGLSVLWSILGAAGFAAGLAVHRPPIRLFGLGLLGLATAKVFLVDLAALDVSYRVLSFIALGFLLLISAAVYSRMQRPPSQSHGPAPV
ncbi:MAG: DUF2339 domain-containing protein [Candidatus Limnocylindrales bacterium]